MKEFQRHEIYRDSSELEMIAYMDGREFEAYARAHKLRRISWRTEVNDAGVEFEISAYIVEEAAQAPRMDLRAWRELRNHLQTSACHVNVYSREYKNLCKRIRWINENRL